MNGRPLISIVTPSFNQGRYIRETLQSLVDQDYSNLEVIVQDGGSSDGAIAVAQEFVDRYPQIFRLFVEKDSGQSDALNRGFARAQGEILGFLNSDDTLYPGCLQSVAREIDPGSNRHVVMGRCLFTGEDSVYVGAEHPARFVSHFEHLAIWKRGHNTIPQPSVFWHRSVWGKCGGFDPVENHALDYDLFCRFSRHYRFHQVDELWSTYRMHRVSKSAQSSEPEILELCIGISRRYWGPWFSPLRWRCAFSHWLYCQHHHEKARHHARRCEKAVEAKQFGRVLLEFLLTARHSPRMARDRLLAPYIAIQRLGLLQRLLINPEGGFTGRYDADQWVGPLYRQDLVLPQNACRLVLILQHSPQGARHGTLKVALSLNRKKVIEKRFTEPGQYTLDADIQAWQGRRCIVELRSDSFFVPRDIHNVPDDRRLSIQLVETRVETTEDGYTGRYESDLWIGPLYRQELVVPRHGRRLVLTLQHSPQGGRHKTIKTSLYLDQHSVLSNTYTTPGRYTHEIDVRKMQGRHCSLELRTDNFFVPRDLHNVADDRRLSIQLIETRVENTDAGFTGRYDGDSYIGPHYYQEIVVPPHAIRLVVLLNHSHQGDSYRAVRVDLRLNQESVATVQCAEPGTYVIEASLRNLQGQSCIVELCSDNHFIPRAIHNVPDDRKLSVQLLETRIEPNETGFTGRYDADSFIGPHFRQELAVPSRASRLVVNLLHAHHGESYKDVNVNLLINGETVASQHCTEAGPYVMTADLGAWKNGNCTIELRSNNYFVPRFVHGVGDDRQLSIQLSDMRVEPMESQPAG